MVWGHAIVILVAYRSTSRRLSQTKYNRYLYYSTAFNSQIDTIIIQSKDATQAITRRQTMKSEREFFQVRTLMGSTCESQNCCKTCEVARSSAEKIRPSMGIFTLYSRSILCVCSITTIGHVNVHRVGVVLTILS